MVYKEMNKELPTLLNEIGLKAKSASAILNTATNDQKNKFFDFAISSIHKDADTILAANQVDIKAAEDNKKDEAFIDRLALDKGRLEGICDALAEIKSFKDPVGKVLASWDRPNGLNISRVATPLGVIGLIFESRPNVAADAGGLMSKIWQCGNFTKWKRWTSICYSHCSFSSEWIKALRSARRMHSNCSL
jgi:glutamate-5-semialdehyde dehydrogenase